MKALVIYDTKYGNTEKIAEAIAGGLGPGVETRVVTEVDPHALGEYELLVFGTPTWGGRPTPALKHFLGAIPAAALRGRAVAAFDTRLPVKGMALPLRLLIRIIGFAAGRVAGPLQAKGGNLVLPAEGFMVADKEGPLLEGEEERARGWAHALLARTLHEPARL
jgi:flavodoxin I